MKLIYLSPRFLLMMKTYQNLNVDNVFSEESIFELFNSTDLSIIRAQTLAYMDNLPVAYSNLFKLHDRFNSIVLDYNVVSQTNFSNCPEPCFTAMNDKSILAFDDLDCNTYSLANAIAKVHTPDEIIGTPIWDMLLSKY